MTFPRQLLTKFIFCGIMKLPDYLRDFSRGGDGMDIVLAFLVSVAAGLFVEMIRTFIDRNR